MEKEIRIGQEAKAIVFAWREDELSTEQNFFIGIVAEIFERTKNVFYVRFEGLSKIIPIDRVSVA